MSSCQTLNFLLSKLRSLISQHFVGLHKIAFVEASLVLIGHGPVVCTEGCFNWAVQSQGVFPGLSVVCLV